MSFWNQSTLYNFLKFEPGYNGLNKIYSPLPQQVLKYVEASWTSYFNSHKDWKVNPEKYPNGEPRIPYYGRKYIEFLISFPGMYVNNIKYAKTIVDHYNSTKRRNIIVNKRGKIIRQYNTGELLLPRKFLSNFPSDSPFPIIRTTVDISQIQEVKIVPKKCCYEVQIVYPKKIEKNPNLSYDNVASLDIGVNILVAMVTNLSTNPILFRGKNIKSINQYMNKEIAKLQSVQMIGRSPPKKGDIILETMEMARIKRKRFKIIDSYFHKVSRYIINYCLEHKIGRLAVGYNTFWKQKANMGKKGTQTFIYIPFWNLLEKIQYKARLVGIEFGLVNESHTSKCSALDFEIIKHHDQYMGRRKPSTRGRKKKSEGVGYKMYYPRGLFRSAKGLIIHSDVNGAYNIGRRAFPDAFNRDTLSIKDMLKNPITARIC